jgi:copper chaperone CopZ
MIKMTFRVPDMHCSACVMRLEGLEDELAGVLSVKASFHHQNMSVDYDENLISEAEIINAIEEKGYHAVRLD